MLMDVHTYIDEAGSPVAQVEGTYIKYKMSVNVPDVKCDKVQHLLQSMFSAFTMFF